MKRRKSIFQSIVFWNVVLAMVFGSVVVGSACGLIFHIKIFDEWGRTEVVKLEDYNGYNAMATYIVDGIEYKKQVGHAPGNSVGFNWIGRAWSGEIDLYVDYLVSDPSYIFAHNTKTFGTIVYSVLMVGFAIIGIREVVKMSKDDKKEGKKSESKQEH